MTVAYIGYTALLEVQLARGDLEATTAALERAEQILVTHLQDAWFLRALFLTEPQVRFWLARGETERAALWIEAQWHRLDRRPAPLAHAREELARVRVLLAQHKGEEALRYLAPLLEEATARDWGHFVIKIRLLQALASQMQKAEGEALTALAQAVHLAEPEGYFRSFVDEGPHMATLLATLRDQQRKRGPTPYLDAVLSTFLAEMSTREGRPEHADQQRPQPLLDPLSERELDVLHLLAQGASNQDIAEALVITVDTVKRHVSNILGKLEANNRMQAVVRARSLGLLSDQS
jgi:LuxR family maltose regulon positive regulatory protein